MDGALATVSGLIVGLLGLILSAIGGIEHALRTALGRVGVVGDAQSVVLVVVLVALAVLALRLFGRVFAVLIVSFLALRLLHVRLPGVGGATGRS